MSGPGAQVERFRPRQVLVTNRRERATPSRVLDADPGQRRIEIIAPIHEPGSNLDPVADRERGLLIAGPDRRRQSELAIVDERDRGLVGGDLHDARHRAEDLLAHHRHGVIDLEQQLRRQILPPAASLAEVRAVERRSCAGANRKIDLLQYGVGGSRTHHRTERRFRRKRIAQHVPAGEPDPALDEVVVEALVHVHTLYAAATLSRVEVRAIDQVFNRVRDIGVVAHIRRIAAAELEPGADETLGGGTLHRVTARHRAGERHEIHARVADQAVGFLVAHVQDLEHSIGQPGLAEAFGEPLRAERRLRRMLEQHHVAREDRRYDAVYCDQVRVVPRRHGQHDAQRLAAEKTRKAVLAADVDIRDRFRPDLDHVPRTLEGSADLVRRVTDRPTHLPAKLGGDRVAAGLEGGAEARQDGGTLADRHRAPAAKRTHSVLERTLDLRRTGKLSLRVYVAVYGTDGALHGHASSISDSSTQVGA